MFMSVVFAQEAVVYRGFSELRQPVTLPQNTWTWEPGDLLYQSLVPGTLRLLGVVEQSRQVQVKEPPNPLAAYVGKKVQFFWEGQWREATVVSPERNLFLYEGRYLVGLPGVIAFPDPSGFNTALSQRVIFGYQGSGAATLNYLTRGLTWNLRYSLEDGQLVGWANLSNALGKTIKLGKTELVAGSVPLLEGGFDIPAAAPKAADSMNMRAEMSAGAEFVGEAGGTYRYKLPGEVSLEPGLTELPFLQSKVTPVYTWRFQSSFSTGREVSFIRGYRFSAPENLAAGVVSIRDQGVFVGQAAMNDSAKGSEVNLSLGPDPEGKAQRTLEQLARSRFKVTTVVKNPKTYPVEVEMQEYFPQPFTLEFQGAERLPEGYRLKFSLKPGESRTLVYTVTLPQ